MYLKDLSLGNIYSNVSRSILVIMETNSIKKVVINDCITIELEIKDKEHMYNQFAIYYYGEKNIAVRIYLTKTKPYFIDVQESIDNKLYFNYRTSSFIKTNFRTIHYIFSELVKHFKLIPEVV
jgi:hypothetical protein